MVLDGRFRVIAALGSGAMGDVYVAEQLSLGRRVALKVLRRDLSAQPGMAERFAREARLLSSVDHPSVVRVIDYGQSELGACLVMDLAEGETLKQALSSGPIHPERAIAILAQLARGLVAIHARGIIHRDIKPENVMLASGPDGEKARLLDFGIARLADPTGDASLTQSGMLVGTPQFLSPEQALGQQPDARTDLYSFGATAYTMLSGAPPFSAETVRELMGHHIHSAPQPLFDGAPALAGHATLCQIVMQCLEKDPGARPQSALDLLKLLEGATIPSAQLAPTAITPVSRAWRPPCSQAWARPHSWPPAPSAPQTRPRRASSA